MRTLFAILAFVLTWFVPGMATGQESGFSCGTTDSAVVAASQDPPPGALSPGDPLVEARIVFIAFPDNAIQTLPTWAEELRSQLSDYIVSMSKGQQAFNINVVQRPDSPAEAWVAPQPASFYVSSGGGGFGAVNRDVMQAIATAVPNVWVGVEHVFAIHYQCSFACSSPSTPESCESSCPDGGRAELGLATGVVPGFTGTGTTQRLLFWPNVNTELARQGAKWVAAHEYGHHLQMQHTPGSGHLNEVERVNPGKYDVMRAIASPEVAGVGLVPYHAFHLSLDFGPHWFPSVFINSDTEDLRIPDIRSATGAIYRVPVPGTTQWFLLANHQGTTPYDGFYANSGLLIWHHLRDAVGRNVALDLESAVGKFNAGGQPDPVAGKDPLEADPVGVGTPPDFFDGATRTVFACGTNPSTSRYSTSLYSSPQSVPTSVAFENIRREAATGDMLVDVFVTPKQKVLAPNGGEALNEGQPHTIQWAVRPSACITSVDLQMSINGGGSFTPIVQSLANSGLYTWTPAVSGTQFRIRAVSRDQAAGTGTDDSNANFSVIDVTAPAVVDNLTIDIVGETEAYLYWFAPGDNLDVGTATTYELRYSTQPMDQANFTSGTLVATSAPQLAGSLEQAVVTGLTPCTPYYFALKGRDEASNWATISNVPYTETACFGAWGGGFAAHRVDGSDGGEGAAVNGIAPDMGGEPSAEVAGAISPGTGVVSANASSLDPPLGRLVIETAPIDGDTWRVSLRLATDADGLGPSGSAITVEGQSESGERDTLGQFTPGETEGLLGICALRERGRLAISGFIRLERVMPRVRHDGQDYALAGVQHSRFGALGAEFVASGGSAELLPGDLIDLTYALVGDVQPQAPPWYLLVRRKGTAVPILFSHGRDREAPLPEGFVLHRSEPNPAGSTTVIRFDLPVASPVKLEVFDLLGRRVASVADAVYPAGAHRAEWNLRDVNGSRARPGFYMVRIVAGDFRASVGLGVLP